MEITITTTDIVNTIGFLIIWAIIFILDKNLSFFSKKGILIQIAVIIATYLIKIKL